MSGEVCNNLASIEDRLFTHEVTFVQVRTSEETFSVLVCSKGFVQVHTRRNIFGVGVQ